MAKFSFKREGNTGCGWLVLLAFFTLIASYITHVVICIKSASWILLAFGCVVFPVAVIHGIGSWFGLFS